MLELFEDREHGGFFSSEAGDDSLVMRIKDDYDGAEPAGNSVAILDLLRLAAITGREPFRKAAERTLAVFTPRLSGGARGAARHAGRLRVFPGRAAPDRVRGRSRRCRYQAAAGGVARAFLPNRVVLLVDSTEARRTLGQWIPAIESMQPLEGRAAVYVCRNYTCQLPVSEAGQFSELLQC